MKTIMKELLSILVVAVGLVSCATSDNRAREKESLDIAKRYVTAIESNNTAAMDSLLADNYMGYGPSVGDSTNKTDAITNWKYNADNLYESVKYTRHQTIAITVNEGEEA